MRLKYEPASEPLHRLWRVGGDLSVALVLEQQTCFVIRNDLRRVWMEVWRFWVLGFGFWVLGFGFWVLGFGFWVLGFGFWVWVLGLSEHPPEDHHRVLIAHTVQGYIAHKEAPPPLGPPQDPRHSSTVGS